ncbi:MAG: helix-hairpin-helix domain-containing protein [Sporichthyaceae bacterium]
MSSTTPERYALEAKSARSLWIGAWLLGPVFVGPFLLWVGARARRLDWFVAGCCYPATIGAFLVARNSTHRADFGMALNLAGVAVVYLGGVGHVSVVVNGLRRRGVLTVSTLAYVPAEPVGERAEEDYLADAPAVAGLPEVALVQANTAAAEDLAALRGVDADLAGRWIAVRDRRGGFADLDDLAAALELMPHQIVRLRPLLSFSDQGAPTRRRATGGRRVLDA